ncbi:hypothetical protein IQ06DRAFT_334 [Phaeosphaeriaceae sp. SRC1lsM3a]|nr:hypothetical protein IQ06DRAFT_334 [Stagonospora sp. SRC1lsM3a]
MLRRYATIASKPPSRLRERGKSPVGLDHVWLSCPSITLRESSLTVPQFIQRQRALALWREIVRSTANITEESARKDMRQFARAEFEQHRFVNDLGHIRYLISYGKTQFQTMKVTLINSGILHE